VVGLFLSFFCPQMTGQIGKIQKTYSATSEHQAPETLTKLSTIQWGMALLFVLETLTKVLVNTTLTAISKSIYK